jgi:DNA (cytosine-5)-methyltransferase 1
LEPFGVDLYNCAETGDKAATLTTQGGGTASGPSVCIPIHDQATRYSGKHGDKTDGKWNGLGIGEVGAPMNTLTSGDRHAVALGFASVFKSDDGSFGDAAPTLVGDHNNMVTDHTAIVVEDRPAAAYGIDRAAYNQGQNAKYDFSILEEQQPTMVAKDHNAVAHCIGNGQVHDALRPDKELCKTLNCLIDPMKVLLDCPPNYIVRRLTPTECARLQGFPDRWGDINSFDPNEWKFWEEVRNTHADINGRAVKEYTEKQIKTWYNKLHTDSAEYKMWGNGIALPPALYVLQGIVEAMIKGGNDNVRKS